LSAALNPGAQGQRGGTAMAAERYVVMTVECQHFKTKQKVHVTASTGGAQMVEQPIRCIKCTIYFRVTVPSRIVGGPFPA
jgi:hypothetical protein